MNIYIKHYFNIESKIKQMNGNEIKSSELDFSINSEESHRNGVVLLKENVKSDF